MWGSPQGRWNGGLHPGDSNGGGGIQMIESAECADGFHSCCEVERTQDHSRVLPRATGRKDLTFTQEELKFSAPGEQRNILR